jgi:hypothetical protein
MTFKKPNNLKEIWDEENEVHSKPNNIRVIGMKKPIFSQSQMI